MSRDAKLARIALLNCKRLAEQLGRSPGFVTAMKASAGFDPIACGWDGDARVCARACHATAAQRAEAFLRCLNLWDDTK